MGNIIGTNKVDIMAAKQVVDQLLNQHKVVVFSKTYCPYCKKAKRILSSHLKSNMVVVELDERDDGSDLQAYLAELTGARSVPRVFIGGKCIGGGDDTEALDRSGQLIPMLESVGAL